MEKVNITPEEDALAFASGLFLVDEVDGLNQVQQFEKLKKAKGEGKGDSPCYEYAEVWQSLWAHTVDEVIDIVEITAKSYLTFLERHR